MHSDVLIILRQRYKTFIKLFIYTIIFHQLHTEIDISNIQPKDKATMPTEETHRGGSNEECINVKNVS